MHYLLTGQMFMPHQRYISDVVWELDPDTVVELPNGLITGRRWYDTGLEIVPRQNGKTTRNEAHMIAASRRGDMRRGVAYGAQNLDRAGHRLMIELERMKMARPGSPFRRHYKPRYSNGSQSVTWHADHSYIAVIANNDEAGHGLTLDDAVVDEAWVHRDLTVVTALQPTMLTRPDPFILFTSTIGEGDDGLLMHYQDLALAAVNDPTSRMCAFEWSAGPDDDRDDPAVWRTVMPALGHTITEERVRSFRSTTPDAEWDRSFLCRRPTDDLVAKLPPADWAFGARDRDWTPSPPYTMAAAVSHDRSHTTIAIAGVGTEPDRVGVIIDRRPGVSWAATTMRDLAHTMSVPYSWADRRGGAGAVIDSAAGNGLVITEMDTADVVSSCGTFYDLVVDRRLEHAAHPDLDLAATKATTRPLGDTWAWCMRSAWLVEPPKIPVDISPILAVTYAAALHRLKFPNGPGRLIQ